MIAEEVFEADVPVANVASMQTRAGRIDRDAVDLRTLVAGFLRMAPDVAIVGEVRDREALPLLLTLSSGVSGFTTIHAGSAKQALTRLRFVCQLSDAANELPMSALNALVSEAIDLVVHCVRTEFGPRVTQIVAVEELQAGPNATQFTTTEVFVRDRHDEPLRWTGNVPTRCCVHSKNTATTPPNSWARTHRQWKRHDRAHPVFARGLGVFYLYSAYAFGWTSLRPAPAGIVVASSKPRRVDQWLLQAGLLDVNVVQFASVMAALFVLGAAVAFAMFGGALPAVVFGLFLASLPVSGYRVRRLRRRQRSHEAWPRMIEEIRVMTGAAGRSVPQALFEVGKRSPEEMHPAFDAAHREWLLTTNFERTLEVLKSRLTDPTADIVCETLLVAHQLGGTDLDRRLAALAQDRVNDSQGRKDAVARQAGARFARWFTVVVPIGMALVGMSIGDGRDAFGTFYGQLLVVVALLIMVSCWAAASYIMNLPVEQRVFPEAVRDNG